MCPLLIEKFSVSLTQMSFIFYIVSVDLFDYLSSIITYIVLGVIIFSGGYDALSSSELSSKISEASTYSLSFLFYFCLI